MTADHFAQRSKTKYWRLTLPVPSGQVEQEPLVLLAESFCIARQQDTRQLSTISACDQCALRKDTALRSSLKFVQCSGQVVACLSLCEKGASAAHTSLTCMGCATLVELTEPQCK